MTADKACLCWEADGQCGNTTVWDSPDRMCDECERGNHEDHESEGEK